jgi:DNA polymerase I-like protein with 3'-5' exonuclease and polymerase domains
MRLILDIENNVTKRNDKLHLDPFEPENSLVMVGMKTDNWERVVTFDHAHAPPTPNGHAMVQEQLDKTTVLVCHNVAHDLIWLWESGFKYDGIVFDTMLGEYVLQRGQKQPLSLEQCAERYALDNKKQDTMKQYFKSGMLVSNIPYDELSEYLVYDLRATYDLADRIHHRLANGDADLMDTVMHTNMVAVCLCKIYKHGFTVDTKKLDEVRKEFEKEKVGITNDLNQQVRDLMGDRPINLNSPEQLSWVIYSRKPKDKSVWSNYFEPYMRKDVFMNAVDTHTDTILKVTANTCPTCSGRGRITKLKKDGTPYKKPNKCITCNESGWVYRPRPQMAGLRFTPPTAKWVSANGFSTNKINLEILEHYAKRTNNTKAELFLKNVRRLSALETYLSSFVEGISTYTKPDGKLHVRLLQHRTSTGRFSGADPNMQNMPRGGTFPVKKIFVSRWEGGKILEADFAQLEFRTAAYLSQDKIAMQEINDGFDVHSYTAQVITDAGQPISRQEAKAHTFAPLYGATGFGRSEAEAMYYEQFGHKYKGVSAWHKELGTEAVNTGRIGIPSGRSFSFPDVSRKSNGTVTYFTQIKNYPVQAFATADIVPLILLTFDSMLLTLQSCIVNSVHDSIVIDVHPDEVDTVLQIVTSINSNMKSIIDTRWNIDFNVPLKLDAKIGDNWLDTKDV